MDYILLISSDGLAPSIEWLAHLGSLLNNRGHLYYVLLLFTMIRSVVESFKVQNVEVVAARVINESVLTCMTDSTPKKTC